MFFNKKPSLAWYLSLKPIKTATNIAYHQKYFKVLEEMVGVLMQNYKLNPWHRTPLEVSEMYNFAFMMTGYLEDFVSEIGLWKAIRDKNKEIYGTPVPLFLKKNSPEFKNYDEENLNLEDICLMIWYNLGQFYTTAFNPQNPHIYKIAEDILEVMDNNYDKLDATSFYDDYLFIKRGQDWGELKAKLHWFAYQSPFVQLECNIKKREVSASKNDSDLDGVMAKLSPVLREEDIFFRTGMRWHGQLCVDMLADVLRGDAKSIQQIREFSKRDLGMYYLQKQDTTNYYFINTFNEQLYEVPKHSINTKIASKCYYFAGFVRWDNHWEMNGSIFGGWDDASIADNLNESLQPNLYFYDKEYIKQIDDIIDEQYNAFLKAFGSDLVMAKTKSEFFENLDKYDAKYYDLVVKDKSMSKEEYIKKGGMGLMLKKHFSNKSAMSMYFNPKLGLEYFENLEDSIASLFKKIDNLEKEDFGKIMRLLTDESISAQAVKHLMTIVNFSVLLQHQGVANEEEFEFLLRYYKSEDFIVNPPRMKLQNLCKNRWNVVKFL